MSRKMRTGLTLVAGLIMATASLGAATSAHAATRSAEAASGISPDINVGNCFGNPFYFYLEDIGSSTKISFGGFPTIFCQARIAAGSSVVTLFTGNAGSLPITGTCLAYNSTTFTISNHAANWCDSGTVSYLEWRFLPVGTDPATGRTLYALRSEFSGTCYEAQASQSFQACSRANFNGLMDFELVPA